MVNAHCDDCENDNHGQIIINSKVIITSAVFLFVFALSYLPGFVVLNDSFISYLKLIWWAVLLGLFLGGVIDYFVPEEFIYTYL